MRASPWTFYSQKMISAIESPKYAGKISKQAAVGKEMRYEEVSIGSASEGMAFSLFFLIDEHDGVIADVKFQVFGPTVLIAILETTCRYLMRKNCGQLSTLTAETIEQQLQGLPPEANTYLNVVIDALDLVGARVADLAMVERESPLSLDGAVQAQQYPGWESLSKEERIAVIEEVIDKEIRPYVEMDEGGVTIVDLIDGKELIIAYQGACTTCYSATGATLNAIQGILRQKVSPDLKVTPDSSVFYGD